MSRYVGTLPEPFAAWFARRGWTPRPHQTAMIAAAQAGRSALLVAPTGGGKTLAGFLASLIDLARQPRPGLHTVYVSPLKALATDIARNLLAPVDEMGLDIGIETRTGDTPANRRKRQKQSPPNLLLTTPESLALLLSQAEAATPVRRLADAGHRRGARPCRHQARRPACPVRGQAGRTRTQPAPGRLVRDGRAQARAAGLYRRRRRADRSGAGRAARAVDPAARRPLAVVRPYGPCQRVAHPWTASARTA